VRTRSFIPAALLLCGCSLRHDNPAPAPARAPARDSLFRFDQSRTDSVGARGFANGMLAFLAPDAAYLRAGAPIVYGRDATRSLLSAIQPDERAVSFEPLGGGVANDLLAAYTYGVAARAAGSGVRIERYLAFWVRSRGQPWRIVAYAEVGGPVLSAPEASAITAQAIPAETPTTKAISEARASLRAADSSFSDLSYRMGTAFAFSNTVADDGIVFGTPELAVGPTAVRESLLPRASSTSLTWRPVYVFVASSRDIGYSIGESVSTGRGPSGAAIQRAGKYLTVWRNGREWKFLADGGSVSPVRP
jgi:hypothetical protein